MITREVVDVHMTGQNWRRVAIGFALMLIAVSATAIWADSRSHARILQLEQQLRCYQSGQVGK